MPSYRCKKLNVCINAICYKSVNNRYILNLKWIEKGKFTISITFVLCTYHGVHPQNKFCSLKRNHYTPKILENITITNNIYVESVINILEHPERKFLIVAKCENLFCGHLEVLKNVVVTLTSSFSKCAIELLYLL